MTRHTSRHGSASANSAAMIRWALWFAVLAGLGQALLVALTRLLTGRLILLSADVVWTAPAVNAVVFTMAAVPILVAARWLTQSTRVALALSVFVFLFLLGPLLVTPSLHPYAAIVIAAGMGVQAARVIGPRVDWFDMAVRRTLPVVVALSAALGVAVHLSRDVLAQRVDASLPPAQAGAPNVLLVVLDTVRAQSLSLYGYERKTSPRLDDLARGGVVFERALSTSPWTLPSHATLFTGRLPHELSADWLSPLNAAQPTLAETFAARGYMTAGFVANLLYCTTETGLGRGFSRYRDYQLSPGTMIQSSWLARILTGEVRSALGDTNQMIRKSAADVNREFLAWLAERPRKPFFAFLNYFDAHAPYAPPPPFDMKFGAGGPQADLAVRRSWSRQEIQRSMDAYDSVLAYVDDQLGRLLDALNAQGLLENTVVVVTSDHGEQFGEHGLFDHGNSLYRPLLHVPLVISFPPRVRAGARIAEPITLADLAATLVDLSSDRAGGPGLPGRSLRAHWDGSQPVETRSPALLAEVSKAINMPDWLPATKGPMKSVIVGGMHYIRNGDGREELYDFERDVDEVTNLVNRAEASAALEEARRALARLLEPG